MFARRTSDATPHERWMEEALELAQRSVGVATPNPAVGCILVRDGGIVGKGFHGYDWLDHAEVVALNDAGRYSHGATAYVTLEPCCHTGRTGPCTKALIAAGVSRVVVATGDPNPQVNGKGIAELREAGIEVITGVLEREAQHVNDGFARHVRSGMPFVTLKAAMSLDGRIAPIPGTARPGAPVYLTAEKTRAEVHRMRNSVDAVMTGINTVLQDDPQMTDRSGLPRRRPLLRVVLDSALRIPLDSKLVRSAKEDVLIFCAVAPTERQRALEAMGIRVERVDPASADTDGQQKRPTESGIRRGGVSLAQVFRRLGGMELLSVMLESGAQLNGSALNGQHVDKLTLFYAPVFLGPSAVPLMHETITGPLICGTPEVTSIGQDVRVDAYLRDPWA
ncbi:MAG TPA: bifunctional diaminohydroxyphosphoribosylaminopyrimidine deaminase/5-amino-6-(5-phosphoribosylamino)uracil reductase RibD [Acidobacteriaceae bacterium]|nr:bifunctional diaminohydroxyphosphoribosylaminopyrimidine deaminase/5-amino-6-(5-phosphoribosylamino)uracil reductase RibD [Acidobacteriaceae bacterium]